MKIVLMRHPPFSMSFDPPSISREIDVEHDPTARERAENEIFKLQRENIEPLAISAGLQAYVSISADIIARSMKILPQSVALTDAPKTPHIWGVPVYLDPLAKRDEVRVLCDLAGARLAATDPE